MFSVIPIPNLVICTLHSHVRICTVQIFSSKVVVLSYIITQSSRVQIFSQQTLQRGFPKDDLSVSVRCMDQFVNLDTNMVLVLVPRYPLHSALKKGEKRNKE